jgi:hypothetical protein
MQEIVIEVQTLAAMRPDLEPSGFPVAVNLKALTGFHTAEENAGSFFVWLRPKGRDVLQILQNFSEPR